MDGSTVRKEGYATTLITDDALTWLTSGRDQSKPFCLVVGHKAPHRTWMPDTTDLRAFDGKEFKLPANFYDDYSGRRAAGIQKMSITQDMLMAYDLKVDDAQEAAVKRMNPAQRNAWNTYYQPLNEDFKKKNLSGKALDD
jgi:hypothetical protein